MGLTKDISIMYEERGYKHSEKCICGNCASDEFLSSKIRRKGTRGKCSFCGGRRNILEFDYFAGYISEYIKHNYDKANDCLSYDKEDGYFGKVINTGEIIDNISEEISDNSAVIDELKNIFFDELYTSEFKTTPHELDEELWDRYCELLRQRKENAETIVSMCKRKGKPEDIEEIEDILHVILSISKDMYMRETIGGLPIYRTVNYLKAGEVTPGFDSLIASYIGTPPPSKCAENRFSERGDMVFYGSSNEEINKKEIGQPEAGQVFTTGRFYTNKSNNSVELFLYCKMEKTKLV